MSCNKRACGHPSSGQTDRQPCHNQGQPVLVKRKVRIMICKVDLHLFNHKIGSANNRIKTNKVKQANIARRDPNDLLSVKDIDNNLSTEHQTN